MRERLSRGWRMIATGLCFAAFGASGLLLRLLIFPLLHLLVWSPSRRTEMARAVIRFTFQRFIALMQSLGVLRYEVNGAQRLHREGLLILANHPTLIDTVFLMALVRRADCVAKAALWRNPFTGGALRSAGYQRSDAGPDLVPHCIASLRSGNNLIIFPEGTRTAGNGILDFKRGAANIAVRGACDVTPVRIRCQPPTLGKGEKWWQVPARLAHFRIDAGEDIPVARFLANGASPTVAARRLNTYLHSYFNDESGTHA